MKTGIELIAEERRRQIEVEGLTPEHDKYQDGGQLAAAAASYAFTPFMKNEISDGYKVPPAPMWPEYWLAKWWKPSPRNRIRELQKAGALIAAEIDRLIAAGYYEFCENCDKVMPCHEAIKTEDDVYLCKECDASLREDEGKA